MNSAPEEKSEGRRQKDEVIFGAAAISSAPGRRTLQTKERARRLRASRSLISVVFLCATLGLLWFILCRDLSLEWSSNEQYSYGWFVPFFGALLFWLRVEERQRNEGRRQKWAAAQHFFLLTSSFLLLLLFPVRLFEVANPDWRPLSWIHALIVVGFTLLVIGYVCRPAGYNPGEAAAGFSTSSAESGGKADFQWAAVRHFAFPVCFILVAVPWLTPIEAPIV